MVKVPYFTFQYSDMETTACHPDCALSPCLPDYTHCSIEEVGHEQHMFQQVRGQVPGKKATVYRVGLGQEIEMQDGKG